MSIGPKMPICSKVPICPGAHFSWCAFAPNVHFPPMLTCPNAHRSQDAHYAPKCSFAANTRLPWCSFFLVPIFPKCPFAPKAHLPLCPSVSKILVCPIKCPKYPFASVTSCPYDCAHFSWCPFFSSAHLPRIAKGPFAPVPIYFTFLIQVKTVMVSATRGC